ncbi:hypothetical protein K435DRAFT_807634 [Dendrothele bispora CBS 962.96]|uniref:Ricin B lectin domain-containing protein n=1 Tax=Dendrothele bispora (strain CBS 962.96) TaxID=1314807 RepID=A0A4S8L5E4_DENBC|nr:hypothetical protein K435DRAFT_807634 [Dendrothele bispora CBS 962.96]
MVNLLSLAAATAAASISILDHTQLYAVDLANTGCKDYTPVGQFQFHRTTAEGWNLHAVAPGQFQIENIACGNLLTYAGSVTGTVPERSQLVDIAGSNTVWNITSTNATNPTGPFRFIESVSGRVWNGWANDPIDNTSSPITMERNRAADSRQLFYFTQLLLPSFSYDSFCLM